MKPQHLPRLLRTLRHYRPVQLAAQLRHVLQEEGRPGPPRGAAPPMAIEGATAPFLPAPPHAKFDGEAGFELIRRKHRFGGAIDWQFDELGPLWAFHLHQFDWARSPGVDPAARTRLILDWIEHCERSYGWAPHPISLRILSWGKLILTPGALVLGAQERETLHASLAQQAEALAGRLEYRLQANHLFSNLLGLVFAGVLFEGSHAARWLGHEPLLRRELERQILSDGSHVERSPMYHALLLENVLDLLNVALASQGRAPQALVQALEDAAARMLGAHAVWTHPDGEIALLGDAAFDIAHAPRVLSDYAASLGVDARAPASGQLVDAGVYRLEAGAFTLIATTGPPAPSHQPGHAHCDALSFELSYGDERVISDTGVSEYIPGPLREASRATSSHATIQLGDQEQSEIWSAHRVGGRANCRVVAADDAELRASCSPWSLPKTSHERHFSVRPSQVEIADRIEGEGGTVRLFLPMGPDVEALELDREGRAAHLRLRSGTALSLELPNGVDWQIERRPWFPRFGEAAERDTLVGKAGALASSRIVFRERAS